MHELFSHKHFVHGKICQIILLQKSIIKKGILCYYYAIKLTVEWVCMQIFGRILKYAISTCFSALLFDCFSLNYKLYT